MASGSPFGINFIIVIVKLQVIISLKESIQTMKGTSFMLDTAKQTATEFPAELSKLQKIAAVIMGAF